MKQMNVDDPIYGYVFDYMVVENGGNLSLVSTYIHPKVEPEIGFVIGEDLAGPGVTCTSISENGICSSSTRDY